ncbi:MAG: serine hydroxymethyltransferase [bacterium]|nr:serine hydroxymethyltransferase [bacterium]
MSKKLIDLIQAETKRQNETLGMIPSENIADPEMLKILGSPLVNKYSEGYPGKRYYPGNEFCDQIENLARTEGLKAFGLSDGLARSTSSGQSSADDWFLNVQPYSGSPANLAIYFALAKPGETVMGMRLADGGHLTHGHPVNFSGTYYKSVQYGVDHATGLLDYDAIEKLVLEHKPVLIFSGTTAYSRTIDFRRMGEIAKKVGAKHVADISHIAGLVATDMHPSPFPHADVVMATTHKTLRGPRGAVIWSRGEETAKKIDKAIMPGLQGGPHNNQTAAIAWMFEQVQTPGFKEYGAQIVKNAQVFAKELIHHHFTLVAGGTDNHLILIDMRNKNVDGSKAQEMLESIGIIANRNSVPGDDKPFRPSGVRMGTPSLTSRGMKEKEMAAIALIIHQLFNVGKPVEELRADVLKLCKRFPLPY